MQVYQISDMIGEADRFNPQDQSVVLSYLERAKAAAMRSYSPYSQFSVGAVAIGQRFWAALNNCECASYGLTNCAERNSIQTLAGLMDRKLQAVLIWTPTPEPTMPCGACRQVIWEFSAGKPVPILAGCNDPNNIARHPITDLLPNAFGPLDLGFDLEKLGLS